ncbi:MAG: extracellular solute-binding protein, partial [Polyangiaceae bacterium]|nr:extracellular solute-binding protein [Polyangiaceae bacterium]
PGRGPRGREVRVLTDRTESHLAPLFSAFEQATGIAVRAVYLEKGLLARLESRPDEADVVITKDADLLEIARHKGLLQPLSSAAIEAAVPERFREPSGAYFSDSYRARVIFYARDRVEPAELSTYEALAEPKWKGRVCIRSGYHDYNLSLFGQMMSVLGPERTRAFLAGLRANLARTPGGDDRGQVRAIYEGKCDVAIANSYYMGIMLSSAEQRSWGLASAVFFPDQSEGGSFILRSGLALTRSVDNVEAATALLEHLVRPETQDLMANLTFAYPVAGRAPLNEVNQELGAGQPGIERGVFEVRSVPLADIVRNREAVLRMLDALAFDQPR